MEPDLPNESQLETRVKRIFKVKLISAVILTNALLKVAKFKCCIDDRVGRMLLVSKFHWLLAQDESNRRSD